LGSARRSSSKLLLFERSRLARVDKGEGRRRGRKREEKKRTTKRDENTSRATFTTGDTLYKTRNLISASLPLLFSKFREGREGQKEKRG